MTTVITSIFGNYDELPAPVPQSVDAEWVCFTDEDFDAPDPWQVVVLGPAHPAMKYPHPRDKTVWCKTQPWVLVDDPHVIWVDANSSIVSWRFVEEASQYTAAGFATYRHPHRDCIYDELVASRVTAAQKYEGQPLEEQIADYEQRGHPAHGGLYAVGTCVYDTSRNDVRELCTRWLEECERWSYQTQLSLPVVARELGFTVGTFDHHQIISNPWLRIGGHLSPL